MGIEMPKSRNDLIKDVHTDGSAGQFVGAANDNMKRDDGCGWKWKDGEEAHDQQLQQKEMIIILPPMPLQLHMEPNNELNKSMETHHQLHHDSYDYTNDDPTCNNSSSSRSSVLRRVFDLLKGSAPGSDLTRFQVPIQLNMSKSQLQMYGESVYCCNRDLLGACARGATATQRFLNVVAWHISTTRLAPFAQAPFNPILGETHHVTSGNLDVILEQVSHHPPITALYATNKVDNIRVQWWHNACPRFYGNKVEVTIHGKRNLWLDSHEENYEMSPPKLMIRLFPVPNNEWVGNTFVKCDSSGLEANINFKSKPLFGLRGHSAQVCGQIWNRRDNTLLYEINGHWNRVVTLKDVKSGKTSVLYDAQDCLVDLKPPIVTDIKSIKETESLVVWRPVMEGLLKKDWEIARKAKNEVEQKQREQEIFRKKSNIAWKPKYFELDNNQWQWRHSFETVSQAPLAIP